jgi:hypothetical protein
MRSHYVGSAGGKMELWNCAKCLRLDPDNADAAKALYIAREQAKAQPGDVRKRP